MTQTQRTFSQDDVVVRLHGPKSSFEGVLADSQVVGANVLMTIDFPHTDAPNLFVGEDVSVDFPRMEQGAESRVTGTVVLRSEDPFRRRFQLQVGESDSAVVANAESRRGPTRVRPSTTRPVLAHVVLPGGQEPVAVEVNDVSTTGLSLLVDREQEGQLAAEWDFTVRLQLPGEESPLEFTAAVRYRRLTEGRIHYGVELDAEHTPDFERRRDRLADYVQRRHLELLARA